MSISSTEVSELQSSVAVLAKQGWAALKLGSLQVQVTVQDLGSTSTRDISTDDWQRVAIKYQSEKQALREQLEVLLTDSDAGTQSTVLLEPSEDRELELLRVEANALKQQGSRLPVEVQRELDYAEDLYVLVTQGEDPKRLRAQLKVLASALIQTKARQVAADTAKLANSLSAKLQALEQVKSPYLPRTKLRTCPASANASTDRILFSSPRMSILPQAVTSREEDLQRTVDSLKTRLERYRALDDSLALERGRLQAYAAELQTRKAALERREQNLFQQELAISVKEDQLRYTICRTLVSTEAREYMRERAADLHQERFLLGKERQHLDSQATVLKHKESEVAVLRQVLERRLRMAGNYKTRAQEAEKKLKCAKEQLRSFLLKMP